MANHKISNSFHNAETTTKYGPEERDEIDEGIYSGRLDSSSAEYQARQRAWRKLCGIKDCTCCNSWGIRG